MCMVGMGDVLTREEADNMIDAVDEDKSGEVELGEFVEVMTKKAEHSNTKEEVLQAFEFLGVGGGSHGLPAGEIRMDKIAMWLELFRPKDAKVTVEDCVNILSRSEKDVTLEGPGGKPKPFRVVNYHNFVNINS